MTTKEKLSASFWCGWAACVGVIMAYQDYVGLESYINRIRAGWVDLHWLVGASIAVIGFFFAAIIRSRK